jgi:predicted XRE-type DNA-binding protein
MSERVRTVMVDGEEILIEESSGNVFADMGLTDPEERMVKAVLSRHIDQLIRERGLTQTHAAEILGIKQPDVSAIVRGRVGGWTIERLTRMLTRLGQDVEITVRAGSDPEQGHLNVRVA